MSGWQHLWVSKVDLVVSPQATKTAQEEPIPGGGETIDAGSDDPFADVFLPPEAFRSAAGSGGGGSAGGGGGGAKPAATTPTTAFQAQRHVTPSSFCQWHFNDDLISLIFAFLGDGRSYAQAAGLAQVCKDWHNCVRFHSSFWTALDVDRFALPRAHVEDSLVESLLRRYRDMVQSVTIRDCLHLTERSVLGVAAHCPNLVSLDVESVGSYLLRDLTASVVAVVDGCRGLRHLNLSSCPNLSGAAVRHIGGRALQLQSLRLRHNARLACDDLWALRRCTELRVLDLGGCGRVRDRTVLAVCGAAGKQLRVLNLSGCPLLTDGAVKAAFERCGGLEALDVCGLPLLTMYAFLPLVQGVGGLRGLEGEGGGGGGGGVGGESDQGGGSGGHDEDGGDDADDPRAQQAQDEESESSGADPRQRRHASPAATARQRSASSVKRCCGQRLRSLRFSVTPRMTYATARNLKALRPDVRVFFLEPRMGALVKGDSTEERTVTVATAATADPLVLTAAAPPRKRKVTATTAPPAPAAPAASAAAAAAAGKRGDMDADAAAAAGAMLSQGDDGEGEEKLDEAEGEDRQPSVAFRSEGGRSCAGGGGGAGVDSEPSVPLSRRRSISSSERAAKLVRLMR